METLKTRYSFGGEEFLFVELSEEMSLEVNFKVRAITNEIKNNEILGVQDVCPANASYMIRFNPDEIKGTKLIERLKRVEESLGSFEQAQIKSRLVDVPVYFEDPWTHQTMMKFRDRHQEPESTDLEYAAKINGFNSIESFINAITNSPFFVSMIGFVSGLPFCTQIVPRRKQIEVPKYVRPRTYTPERCFAIGGNSAVIYPADGTGGAQMLGITPAPVFEREQRLYDFTDSIVFPRQGDIFRFRSIGRDEYETIREEVNNGTFKYLIKDFNFIPNQLLNDLEGFADTVMWRLYHD